MLLLGVHPVPAKTRRNARVVARAQGPAQLALVQAAQRQQLAAWTATWQQTQQRNARAA